MILALPGAVAAVTAPAALPSATYRYAVFATAGQPPRACDRHARSGVYATRAVDARGPEHTIPADGVRPGFSLDFADVLLDDIQRSLDYFKAYAIAAPMTAA